MKTRTGGHAQPPFPFELKAARFTDPDGEWAVLSYSTQRDRLLWGPLSNVEREVLSGLLAGHSNAAIARMRGTTERTVANQIGALLRRFRLGSRRELIAHFAFASPNG
jgi:DNA-binding CsgD family transcriptional regulator